MTKKRLLHNLVVLCMLYLNIILSFALVYALLDGLKLGPIVDHYASVTHQMKGWDRITRSVYFSAVTLLSVGYGDITPFGWSKPVAILEAMIGYILPATIVIQYLQMTRTEKEKSG